MIDKDNENEKSILMGDWQDQGVMCVLFIFIKNVNLFDYKERSSKDFKIGILYLTDLGKFSLL